MVSESSFSSRVSLISVDPAVASHITGTSRATTAPAASQHDSSPGKTTASNRPPLSDRVRRHGRNNSAPTGSPKKRSNSLRRAKNSTEVLRQRSTRSAKKAKQLETIAGQDTRGGRNFTIGNVGTGGVLYLRPSAHQTPLLSSPASGGTPATAPPTVPSLAHHGGRLDFYSHPNSRAQSLESQTPSVSPRRPSTRIGRPANYHQPTTPHHGRSQSFSTIEEHRHSLSPSTSRTLRIVINRPDTARPTTSKDASEGSGGQQGVPTLEVPIPHYRIGTPRFSVQGTPILRSSVYTRTSTTSNEASPSGSATEVDQYVHVPPASSLPAFAKMGDRTQSQADATSATPRPRSPPNPSVSLAVFDELARMYDDPSVVRYSQNVKEITAATPARIIAQISSESFMDYDLVSDFFLTFRSYMSTYTVVDLLLARLRWAIGRLEEDGRIIRVRTFAALRHWILNYFLDDFVVDRRLRERFCAEINTLYADVKASPDHSVSDLKLLRDLKRCWNGRCSLYWDAESFELDGDQEANLKPGGATTTERRPTDRITGPRDRQTGIPPPMPLSPISAQSWLDLAVGSEYQQQQEAGPAGDEPTSLVSEGSLLQPSSCFAPKTLLRYNGDASTSELRGPQPVSVQLRRKNAPAPLQVVTQRASPGRVAGHKRGVSSIDSIRDPTPLDSEGLASLAAPADDSSLIRGLMCGPNAPFVHVTSSVSTQSLDRSDLDALRVMATRRPHGPNQATTTPKRMFGSIRKALGNKNGLPAFALVTIPNAVKVSPTRGQKSHVPLNVSRSHDELRDQASLSAYQGEMRIDLLCAAVCQNYEASFPVKHRTNIVPFRPARPVPPPTIPHEAASQLQPPGPATRPGPNQRLASNATAQSGSILIVDDTGPDPAMSGALLFPPPALKSERSGSRHSQDDIVDDPDLYPANAAESVHGASTQRSSNLFGNDIEMLTSAASPNIPLSAEPDEMGGAANSSAGRDTSPERKNSNPATASSMTVRERKSDPSSPHQERRPSLEETRTPLSSPGVVVEKEETRADDGQESKLPPHTLRRRPGGDLRNVENVHDLDHSPHHESLDTNSAGSNSPSDSLLIMKTDPPHVTDPSEGGPINKPISMINTHSSQHLRPSFEAAVAGFSAIPDDDDGGLEATLMKLEGRYERKSPPMDQFQIANAQRPHSMPNRSQQIPEWSPQDGITTSVREIGHDGSDENREETGENRGEIAVDGNGDDGMPTSDGGVIPSVPPDGHEHQQEPASRKSSIFGLPTESVVDSEDSYNSLPLLRRETQHAPVGGGLMFSNPSHSPPMLVDQEPNHLLIGPPLFHLPKSSGQLHQNHARHSLPRPATANESAGSFLLDEDENLSDLSSEISVDIINYSEVADQSLSPMLAAPGTAISGLEIPAHPLTYASVVNLNALAETAPWLESSSQNFGGPALAPDSKGPPAQFEKSPLGPPSAHLSTGPAHLPFLLVCDSQLLAQQMTLVEKSALSEVEWSDLVEMRWHNKSADVRDWVDCLTRNDIQSVDLVITRFNLVVRWALSEIVLTQDIQERAQVITKLIHLAAHARRLHNYATMLQITIALTSTDCTRLSRTWQIVPAPDRSLLKNMEMLIQPVRNFHHLRVEMESADLSDGCIPFIGLYVHDLTYNAQKPARVPGGQDRKSLINFERYRTTAVIVKGLLRLIDASSRYNFEPVEGVIEKCLWLAALSEDRIATMSRGLEN